MTCQTVDGIQLNCFNVKEKWERRGRRMLIRWANKRDNGQECKGKEGRGEESKMYE